jgi:hypothetical protein
VAGAVEEGESALRLVHAELAHNCGDETALRASVSASAAWVRAAAERISDDGLRTGFLRDVPENARLIAWAASL